MRYFPKVGKLGDFSVFKRTDLILTYNMVITKQPHVVHSSIYIFVMEIKITVRVETYSFKK